MDFSEFKQQTVLVTGAASGIGRAQAAVFLAHGAKVVAIDQNATGLVPLAKQGAMTFDGSVTDVAFIQRVVAQAPPIDIVCNTAGRLDDYQPILETSLSQWQAILDVDVTSQFIITQAVLPQMLVRRHGVFVNMSSIAGLVAGGGGVAYTAAKHAVIGLTQQVDLDYAAQGIRANCLAPGAIDTPMNAKDFRGDGKMAQWVAEETPAKRWAQPSEVADLTLFIASHHADYIHGSVIPIDGGWLAK